MRGCVAGLLAAALSLPPGAALSQTEITASFEEPAGAGPYDGDWPVWSRMSVKTTRKGGSEAGIFRGAVSATWFIDPDEDGFFLGNAPDIADVNGDGRSELVVIQYLPASGWRMAAFHPPSDGFGLLGEAAFSAGVDQAVLLGVLAAQNGQPALIGVVVRDPQESRLLIYSFQDGRPVTLGPYSGYGAGPAGPEPRIRKCGDQRAFLVARDRDGTVTAIGWRGDDVSLRVWPSGIAATADGFARAASCGPDAGP